MSDHCILCMLRQGSENETSWKKTTEEVMLQLVWAWPASQNKIESLGKSPLLIRNKNPAAATPT